MKIKLVTTAGGQTFEGTQDLPDMAEPHIAQNAIIQAVSNALNTVMQAKLPLESVVITVT